MDNRKNNHIDPWDDGSYGTGKMHQPKSHSGIIALLLILVIFLSGIVSVLSFLNIRMFYELSWKKEPDSFQVSLSLATGEEPLSSPPEIREDRNTIQSYSLDPGQPTLGIFGETITPFDQNYFHIPQGLYIHEVAQGSSAAAQNVGQGDILLSLEGEPITSQDQLETIVSRYAVGDTLTAVIFREGKEETLILTVTEANES